MVLDIQIGLVGLPGAGGAIWSAGDAVAKAQISEWWYWATRPVSVSSE
jgi:hypothetical protein